jgi:hypothetical protein
MCCFACSARADAQKKAPDQGVQERRFLLQGSLLLRSLSLNYSSDGAQQCHTLAISATAQGPCCTVTCKGLHSYVVNRTQAEFWRVC